MFIFSLTPSQKELKKPTKVAEMQRRMSTPGRPSCTDGSDFSYWMVVDSCRKWSQVNVLRLFMANSSIVVSFLIYCTFQKYSTFRDLLYSKGTNVSTSRGGD
ncbi:uncharacterized protein LOC111276091 [Durio zibethinus]|uniref:Uncharacterized protein LOC111276091 n=1 Tax=Durio zibethinus TaxID=66656 RepID=A0A6P5WQ51_DURZI|nr:uncharacterized protein LOC111276091 [Durio zibethinus]